MAYESNVQNAERFVGALLFALLLIAATAEDIGADNTSLSARPPTFAPPRQRPRIVYKPHGIQFGRPGSAPLPARRNMPDPQNRRRQPFGRPPGTPTGFDLQALGPRGFIRPQEGFAAPPGMRFDPRLPQIPGFELPPGYQDPRNIRSDVQVHGSALISDHQIAPGYQGSRDSALQQVFGPNPFAAQGPPQLSGPAYPPGYRPSFEPSFPPVNPWFGLPVPTPMGPYSQRRPVKPLMAAQPESPLEPPLRDLDDHNSEATEWSPDDSWKGAMRGKVPRPPKPDELEAVLPPYLRVNRAKGKRVEEEEEEVGYMDDEEESRPEYSEEKGYVTTKPTSPSPEYMTRGLGQSTAPVTPPPLLANDILLKDDTPLDDAPSSEAEFYSNIAAGNRNAEGFNDATQDNHAEWLNDAQTKHVEGDFSDDASDEQRRERSNAFDHLLLI